MSSNNDPEERHRDARKVMKNQILENMIGHKRGGKDELNMFHYIRVVLEEGGITYAYLLVCPRKA